MTRDEELELRALVGVAFDARGDDDAIRGACAEIEDWQQRRFEREFERRRRSRAAVLNVLRETGSPSDDERVGRGGTAKPD